MNEPSVLDYVKAKLMPWKYQLPDIEDDSSTNLISGDQPGPKPDQIDGITYSNFDNELKIKTKTNFNFKNPTRFIFGTIMRNSWSDISGTS